MKARIPLSPRTVEGIECPFPLVRLSVRDKFGALAPMDFRVDTQADFTTISTRTAQREWIPYSEGRPRVAAGLVGEAHVYRDRIRIVLAGAEHDWPCEFLKPPIPVDSRRELLPVLGRTGFLDEYAIAVDSGYLIITRIGPIRRWLRKLRDELWTWCGMVHPRERPL